ncbi:MAG: hypothetical protein JKY67_15270 [Pseudomonadales bacterium]|nr:hypothetical protein [Pseudomonadales bacterium]
MNQQIQFLSDGAENLRAIQTMICPEAEHTLDWFHLTMRLTVLNQYSKGLQKSDPEHGSAIIKDLDSAKRNLWHGNTGNALDKLEDCYCTIDYEEIKYVNCKKFQKHLEDMVTYIRNNRFLIPNYGEKYRYGETITTAFVESTINEVVAKRMVKKQQMQWTHQGAHYLLQTRAAVLNNDLKDHFERWYPGLKIGDSSEGVNEEVREAA